MNALETLRQVLQQDPFRPGMKFRPYLQRMYPHIRFVLERSYSRRAIWEIFVSDGGYHGTLRTFYTTLERIDDLSAAVQTEARPPLSALSVAAPPAAPPAAPVATQIPPLQSPALALPAGSGTGEQPAAETPGHRDIPPARWNDTPSGLDIRQRHARTVDALFEKPVSSNPLLGSPSRNK